MRQTGDPLAWRIASRAVPAKWYRLPDLVTASPALRHSNDIPSHVPQRHAPDFQAAGSSSCFATSTRSSRRPHRQGPRQRPTSPPRHRLRRRVHSQPSLLRIWTPTFPPRSRCHQPPPCDRALLPGHGLIGVSIDLTRVGGAARARPVPWDLFLAPGESTDLQSTGTGWMMRPREKRRGVSGRHRASRFFMGIGPSLDIPTFATYAGCNRPSHLRRHSRLVNVLHARISTASRPNASGYVVVTRHASVCTISIAQIADGWLGGPARAD